MALTRSLSAGASSLRAHQQRFDVISNNIANSNTIGFKSSRTLFAEQLKQTYNLGKPPEISAGVGSGGVNPLQFGLGVKVGAVTMDMAQGNIEQTGRPLDLAIQGEGYFVYNMNNKQYYSRAGAITQDKNGYLTDSTTGALLQGYNINYDPTTGKMVKDSSGVNILSKTTSNLRIQSNIISPPKQTENVSITGNLNSANTQGTTRQTSITIYNQRGGTNTLTLTFTKTANANEYDVAASVDGTNVTLKTGGPVKFNTDGTLSTPLSLSLATSDINTALTTANAPFDDTKDITITLADQNNLLSGLTQFAGPNTATSTEQDGYQQGDLTDLSVDGEGKIHGAFTNGQSEVLGQVVLAKFTNPSGLAKDQGNYFSVSPNSGSPNIGAAGENFPSTSIASYSLEQSNVDLTEQFADLISTQRGYEAAARTITVSDQMLSEANMLKR